MLASGHVPVSLLHFRALDFNNYNCCHGIDNGAVYDELLCAVAFFDLYCLAVRKLVSSLDLVLHRRQFEWRARLLEESEVQLSGSGCHTPFVMRQHKWLAAQIFAVPGAGLAHFATPRRWPGTVNRFAIDLQPSPDGAQIILGDLRYHAVRHRADVQKIVAALADDVDELEGDLAG